MLGRDMKANTVLDYKQVLGGTHADTVGEGCHDGHTGRFVQDGHQPESATAGLWINEYVQKEPFAGGLNRTGERLTRGRPDPSANRLETQSMFVQAPQRHLRMETLRCAERLH
ncbi:hypothetical protein GCM10010840_31800 [Deinococcus aerolatus]|uniref:Uncharacterized protein n=1 Tax=Deinococcus aerolatus TaxID=522487 RepID=A0ABQ2GE87_9DEIO|nr:hypothetical protein GCM10010840_31800 [Deinococcus aerolatus]